MSDVTICERCNGSGEVALSSANLSYRGPGPVPDDAKGVCAVTCDKCRGMGAYEDD